MKLNGVMNRAKTVVKAVRLTERATFALASIEIMFETFPPGQAATSIIPNATAGDGFINKTSKKVIAGSMKYCEIIPKTMVFGFFARSLKCSALMLNATPNITKAMAKFIKSTPPSLKFNRILSNCSKLPKRVKSNVILSPLTPKWGNF